MGNLINRTSDNSTYNNIVQANKEILNKNAALSIQLATGKIANNNLEMADKTFEFMHNRAIFSENNQYLHNIEIALGRLENIHGQVDIIRKTLIEFRGKLTQAVSFGFAPSTNLNQFCKDGLNIVSKALNSVNSEGLNNFGGSYSQGLVCDITKLPSYTLGQPSSLLYATGDNSILQTEIDQGVSLSYGIAASETGFADALQCFQIGAFNMPSNDATTPAMQLLQQCMDTSQEADQGLNNIISTVLTRKSQLIAQKQRLEEENNQLEQEISDTIDANPVECYAEIVKSETEMKTSLFTLKKFITNIEDLIKMLS